MVFALFFTFLNENHWLIVPHQDVFVYHVGKKYCRIPVLLIL